MADAPSISVQRFLGLYTFSPNDVGDFAQLIKAENLQFNRAGMIEGRPGFKRVAYRDDLVGADHGWYIGTYTDGDVYPAHFFQIGGSFFIWGAPDTDTLFDMEEPGTSQNRGVQYGGYMFFTDGNKWDGTTLTPTSGYPGTYGPIVDHNERVWCNNNCRLYFSAVGNGDNWPAANFIDVDPVSNDTITELRSYRDRLYIFRTTSVWVLNTPGIPTSWSLRKLSDDGCDYQTSVEYEGILYWFGRRGAYRHDGVNTTLISELVQNEWDSIVPYESDGESWPRISYTAVFGDNWIVCLGLSDNRQKLMCFHTKLNQWTEWVLAWEREDPEDTAPPQIRGMWAQQANTEWVARGLYLFMEDSPNFFVAGIVPEVENDNPSSDCTGTAPGNIFPFSPVLQTKFSDFGEPYSKKRVTQWMAEYVGQGLIVDQFDEENRTVSRTIVDDEGGTHQRRIRGLGYFRRLSMRITFQTPTDLGWYLRAVYGKLTARGQQIKNADETSND